jgi:hypothetical protein
VNKGEITLSALTIHREFIAASYHGYKEATNARKDNLMLARGRKGKDWRFEWEFRFSLVLGSILMITLVVLAWRIYHRPPSKDVDVGVMFATAALALFTAFLWLAATITARFARSEISTSTAVNSANLTLQLDNRFNSDRALRIRHGAVEFLAEHRKVHIHCEYDISPYRTDPSNYWYGLPSDLIDLFNYFDWIGYLTSEESNAIDREVVRQKLSPWIIAYYDMCRAEIDEVHQHQPDHWVYLDPLYEDLIKRRKKWYADHKEPLLRFDDEGELNAFLQREHVRSHRGFHPLPSTTLRE